MGWLDRLLSGSRGYGDEVVTRPDAGMEFRAGIRREALEREQRMAETADLPRRVNSTWQWTGDRWKKWSTVWKSYDDVDQTSVPTPLLDLLGEHGVTPTAGDRFRFVDGEWHALDPGDPDVLPEPAGDGDDGPVENPWG